MDELFIMITYKLANGKRIRIEVSGAVKNALDESDRTIRSQRRQDRRHLIIEEYSDGLADAGAVSPQEDLADLVVRMDSYQPLYTAIGRLSETQRRRLMMRYFGGLTYSQIAEIDQVTIRAVTYSIKQAVETLRNLLS